MFEPSQEDIEISFLVLEPQHKVFERAAHFISHSNSNWRSTRQFETRVRKGGERGETKFPQVLRSKKLDSIRSAYHEDRLLYSSEFPSSRKFLNP
mmetsp:Transcript_4471/g.19149  ORF Transcript_4471/g.19149 Transcript_4471/m.19149 type:complete len:95 (+) Transcript_4471:329-613(+)